MNISYDEYQSPTSSPPTPPTPPSPLPISFGPGNQRYSFFSPSPTPSPPFSPDPSTNASAESLHLLHSKLPATPKPLAVFSLDRQQQSQELDFKFTCLKDLLEWFIERSCSCCARFL